MTYSEKIRKQLKTYVMSQETLAEKVGVSLNTISRYVNGKTSIPIDKRIRINEILHIVDGETIYDKTLLVNNIVRELEHLDLCDKLLVLNSTLDIISKQKG